jgi:hypothetical protein
MYWREWRHIPAHARSRQEATAVATGLQHLKLCLQPVNLLLSLMHLLRELSIMLEFSSQPPVTVTIGSLDNKVIMGGHQME